MTRHPFRNAGICIIVGIVSFAIASAVPVLQDHNQPWPAIAAVLWLIIPALMILAAIALVVTGSIRHFRGASHVADGRRTAI